MSFEIKYQKGEALFHVKIPREVSSEEAQDLTQLALNITAIAQQPNIERVYGPLPPPNNLAEHINSDPAIGHTSQTKLGQKIVDTINMMGYKEPSSGVQIKMLDFPGAGVKIKAIQAFRLHTGMSILGCKEIVYGNFPCPILTVETADKIIEDFRNLEVYAKIVPANASAAA